MIIILPWHISYAMVLNLEAYKKEEHSLRLKPIVMQYPIYKILGIYTLRWHVYCIDYTLPKTLIYIILCNMIWGGALSYG